MYPAIFARTYPLGSVDQLLSAIARDGYEGMQFNLSCLGLASLPDGVPAGELKAFAEAASSRGLAIAGLSGTYNMAHPDAAVRRAARARFANAAAAAPLLGAPIVTLCTGSRNPDDMWAAHPDNASPAAWADLRADAFRATVKKEFPGISIVAESRLAENRNAALTTTEDWLQRFPDLAGIYTATDDIAGGAAVAIKGAGRKGEIKVSTSNFTPAGRKMLESGDIVCTSIQQVVDQGRSAMKQAIAASTHGDVQKLVVSPALLVTPDNIASVDMRGVNAPNDYKP